MNIEITLDLLHPDKAFVLKWLRPDQRATLAHLIMQASNDDLKRLDGEGGRHGKEI